MTASKAEHPNRFGVSSHVSFVRGKAIELILDGSTLLAREAATGSEARWSLDFGAESVMLAWQSAKKTSPDITQVYAGIEGALTFFPSARQCLLQGVDAAALLKESGVLLQTDAPDTLRAYSDMFWQCSQLWLDRTQDVYLPLRYTLSQSFRHPQRAAKPKGVVYRRYIPWLGKTLSFRMVDVERDVGLVHRWMNDPEVARIWQEEGELETHRRYLLDIEADPHMYSMIAFFDDKPFGYFEVYWAKENRIAPFCEAADYDRGWHVLVGEPDFRGKAFATAWLPSISHYIFLDDPRTSRIVGEPRVEHTQQIRNLDRSGYAKPKEFDFPHKRAQLVTLLRERFFTDSLWWPRQESAP